MNLLESLKSLDIENDDNWTDQGLPRLKVLRELTEDVVSHQAIQAIAPKFSRSNNIIKELEHKPQPKVVGIAPKEVISDDITNYVHSISKSRDAMQAEYDRILGLIAAAGLEDLAIPKINLVNRPRRQRRKDRR